MVRPTSPARWASGFFLFFFFFYLFIFFLFFFRIRPFFFDYLVYGSADPILQDFEKKKKKKKKKKFFFFFLNKFSVGGGQINYGVQGTQELEPTDIPREETRHGGPHDLLIVLSNNDCSRAGA